MPFADLHAHTTRSDGELTLEEVPGAATRAGVSVVGLTDHDRLQPFDDPVLNREGVTLIHGIEVRVEHTDLRLDLLGYGVRPTAELESMLDSIQANRRERARTIVERLDSALDIELDIAIGDGIGRPHIARAVAEHPGTAHDYQDVFDELIGADCPHYVARDIPSFERGRRVLAEACELVSLAHPLRYDDPSTALAVTPALDAVELHYPYGRPMDLKPVEAAIREEHLLVTGGSDAHGRTLGREGLDAEAYNALDFPRP